MESLHTAERLDHPERVVVTTGTFYKNWYEGSVKDPVNDVDKVRGDLALETLACACDAGYQIVVVDGGSDPAFLQALDEWGISYIPQTAKGMSPGRQEGFKLASLLHDAEAIVWVEPEKVSFVRDCLVQCVLPILNGEADVIVPERDAEAWNTYPEYQKQSERQANQHWNTVLHTGVPQSRGRQFDVFFGPRVFRNTPAVLNHFLQQADLSDGRQMNERFEKVINPKRYSDATFFPVATAIQNNMRVESVVVPYRHPDQQVRTETDSPEFAQKRVSQRRGIVGELVKKVIKA
jgi:hypothetical protein